MLFIVALDMCFSPLSSGYNSPNPAAMMAAGANTEKPIETIAVDDLLVPPGRNARPERIVIIIRGPPGSGKTYVTKLLKVRRIIRNQA